MSIVLEVWKGVAGVTVTISDLDERGAGTGQRILGPKTSLDSTCIGRRTLSADDAQAIQPYLDKARTQEK